ncbi:hypothetical protein [Paenibacillus polymyxa]|nr:hypothetical protein [Paenibacillus polymyxa]UZP77457.1 hypothetical protein MF627_05480 [Paenibacillus polymyxa]
MLISKHQFIAYELFLTCKRGEGDLGSLSIADIVEKISTEIREKQ